MTHDERSLERAARSWIEDGPTRAPEAAVEAALARIQRTPQERGFSPPWRLPTMVTTRTVVAAVTLVLAVSAGGIALSRFSVGEPGGAHPSPSPDATRTSSPSGASPTAEARTLTASDVNRNLEPGTYSIDGFAAPFSMTLPEGWIVSKFTRNSFAVESRSDGTINVYLAVVDKVYRDPCHPAAGPEGIGPAVDDLVEAMSSMPGFEVTNVSESTIGGASGTSFEISNSIDTAEANCDGSMLPLATYEEDGKDVDIAMFGGESDTFWVLDTGSTRVFMAVTEHALEPTRAVRDSISFADESAG